MSDSLESLWTVAAMLFCPWDSAGQNTEAACHALFQGIFLTQGSNPHLLHWQVDSLTLSHKGSPYALVCTKLLSRVQISVTPCTIACQAPLSIGFSRQEHWSGLPFLSPGDLPDPGTQPVSPAPSALADGFFITEPRGKPHVLCIFLRSCYSHKLE